MKNLIVILFFIPLLISNVSKEIVYYQIKNQNNTVVHKGDIKKKNHYAITAGGYAETHGGTHTTLKIEYRVKGDQITFTLNIDSEHGNRTEVIKAKLSEKKTLVMKHKYKLEMNYK